MPLVYIETLPEFEAKNGGNRLQYGGRNWYRTGASCSADGQIFYPPAKNDYKRLHDQIAYWTVALERAEKDFLEAQAFFLNQAALAGRYGNLPGPQADAEQNLLKLKESAQDCRAEIEWLQEQLEKTPEMQATRMEQKRQQMYRAAASAQAARLGAIRLD